MRWAESKCFAKAPSGSWRELKERPKAILPNVSIVYLGGNGGEEKEGKEEEER